LASDQKRIAQWLAGADSRVGYPSRVASLPDHLMPSPVGRERLSREVLDEHQRVRVLDASIEVFAKRGYPGTTVDHIVAAAKIGVGSFYKLFEGKEDCFLQAYDEIVAEARELIVASIPEDAQLAERICFGLRSLLAIVAAEPLRARLVLVEAQAGGPTALARYEQSLDEVVPILRRCREGSPVARDLPATLEEATVGGIAWLLHQRLVMGEVAGLEDLFEELVNIAVAPYLGEESATQLAVAVDRAASTSA
jgi:AcrR family transcriptional regulator